jgi:hypothetical protein
VRSPALAALVLVLAYGGRVLVRRREDARAHVTWGAAAVAALSPWFAPGAALLFAPMLCAWSGDDPDRRGWWLVYGVALVAAWTLDGPALFGAWGAGWRLVALAVLCVAPVLSLWPLRSLAGPGPRR